MSRAELVAAVEHAACDARLVAEAASKHFALPRVSPRASPRASSNATPTDGWSKLAQLAICGTHCTENTRKLRDHARCAQARRDSLLRFYGQGDIADSGELALIDKLVTFALVNTCEHPRLQAEIGRKVIAASEPSTLRADPARSGRVKRAVASQRARRP